jgi:anti-sigma B factor antagonist
MALNFTTTIVGDVAILALEGRIIVGESRPLLDKIQELVGKGIKKIVLNVGGVSYIDSAGTGTLLEANQFARSSGAFLRLCHLGGQFRDSLVVPKLITIFGVSDSEADAINAFASPPVYCLCPSCGLASGPSLPCWLPRAHWLPQTCRNEACGARFSIGDSQNPEGIAPISRLSFQTYEKEYFEIEPGNRFFPFKCNIVGRLDLFSSAALQKCWRTIPSPRRVLFDLERTTEANREGRKALIAFLVGKEDGARVTASLEGMSAGQTTLFQGRAHCYRFKADALAALGDVSDTPSWFARVVRESDFFRSDVSHVN